MTAGATEQGVRIANSLNSKARNLGIDVPQMNQRYVQGRILARLFSTPQAEHMMLTGGVMYHLDPEMADLGRSTSDVDIQIFKPTTTERLLAFVHRALTAETDDGIIFQPGKYQILEHSDLDQPGLRIMTPAVIGNTHVPTYVDFSVAAKPGRVRLLEETPMIKEQSAVPVQAQTWETSAAEKLHSICKRGLKNTRLKDYRDLYVLAQRGYGSSVHLQAAIEETFAARDALLPGVIPVGLDLPYAQYRQTDWDGYLAKLSPRQREGLPADLSDVTSTLEAAYMPALVPEDVLEDLYAYGL